MMRNSVLLATLLSATAVSFIACGSGDVDPNANLTEPNRAPTSSGDPSGSSASGSGSNPLSGSSSGSTTSSSGASSSGTPSAACGSTTAVAKGYQANQHLTISGTQRTYAVNVPASYDANRRYPVIFVYHGSGGNGAGAKSTFNFESKHDAEAIFVYPDAQASTGGEWVLDKWDASNNVDIAFLSQTIDAVQAKYCVNQDRLFATGFSNGAFFANHVGCVLSERIRAVAAHSGGGPYTLNGEHYVNGKLICKTPKPHGVLEIIGDADSLLPDVNASRVVWTGNLACSQTQTDIAPSPCKQYSGCSAPFEVCVIPGLGHTPWSQGADTIWSFFARL